MVTTQQKKFIDLLEEIFQFDQADLDFGIYRIMNQKRDEVIRFLNKDLVPQVQNAFEKYKNADVEEIKQQIEELENKLNDMGVAKESSEKYSILKDKLNEGVDISALENEVFSDLTNFFRRYYHNGDFLSLRRYKKNIYAIPYEGEEVKLHWANADQYYVKSSEYFRDYTFKLPSEKIVHFKLIEANTEQNNNKAQKEKEPRFILFEDQPLKEENGEFYIYFEYRPPTEGKQTQKQLNESTLEYLFSITEYGEWLKELQTLSPTEKNKKRTLLEKYLTDYTARNTFDYFIHKDLGGFLRRELDFFIKNEVMHLDDLDTENEKRFEQYLSKVKVIKSIGHKIIAFLEQIENFQKKLWLKKKFVVESDYCITLDKIPEEFYEEVSKNVEQIEEWIKLFNIEDLDDFTNPLSVEFLERNSFLLLDTKFFSINFKDRLISQINDIDDNINGLLIHSENFQALNLLQERYQEKINCIYIDPPYNTNATPILYKNNYKDSSWLSLMHSRLILGKKLLDRKNGYHSIAIDDYELHNLYKLLEQEFIDKDIYQVIVNHYPGSGTGRSNVSRTHEYNIFVTPKDIDLLKGELKEGGLRERGFCRSGTGENNHRTGRPNSFYAVLVDENTFEIKGFEEPPELSDSNYPLDKDNNGYRRIYPLGADGSERCWSLSYESAKDYLDNGQLRCTENFVIKRIYFDESSRGLLPSIWIDKKYSAVTNGTNLLTSIFGSSGLFSFPKSLYTVETAIASGTFMNSNSTYLDYFSGSGTTGHAVINLNRNDNGNRKYILVEMGEYFDTVTKPRIQKVIYSKDWKNGKPGSREGTSHIFKYIRLESYEDALNNIRLIYKCVV